MHMGSNKQGLTPAACLGEIKRKTQLINTIEFANTNTTNNDDFSNWNLMYRNLVSLFQMKLQK